MKRIVIVGNAGAGKSTLALKINSITSIPVYHIDKILWKKDWERTPEDEFKIKHNEIIQQDEWILDGVGYESTMEERFSAANMIIFLDVPIETCKKQALNRMKEDNIRPNPYVTEGCRYPIELQDIQMDLIEKIDKEFKPILVNKINKFKNKRKIVHLTDEHTIKKFLQEIKNEYNQLIHKK